MRQSWLVVFESKLIQALLLLGLLCALPIQQLRRFTAVVDADIWWHMRVGQWIIEHHGFPHNGIFSAYGATHPWAAYSWGFEIIVATLNRLLGLKGISVFVLVFELALVLMIFLIARFFSRSFWWAWFLSVLGVWAMNLNSVDVARPVSFSMLFFTIALVLTLRAQETRNIKLLYWLPLLFLVWANFHIQFLYGLLLPGLLAAVTTVNHWVAKRWPAAQNLSDATQAFSPGMLWLVFAACVAATFVNPYTIGLYRVILNYMQSSYAFNAIIEFRAPSFRVSAHYVELLLVAGAFFGLGRQKVDPFKLSLLTITALLSFRSVRDVWFVCIPAVAILACSVRKSEPDAAEPALGVGARQLVPILAGALFVIVLSGVDNGFNERALFQTVHDSYPVDAVKFIQEHHLPGPIYNNFNWGGFLIGNLPDYPVSIDGRTDLYGDDYFRDEIDTLLGRRNDNPLLNQARLVLLPSSVPLAGILRVSPQFKLVYSDNMAMVFVRNP